MSWIQFLLILLTKTRLSNERVHKLFQIPVGVQILDEHLMTNGEYNELEKGINELSNDVFLEESHWKMIKQKGESIGNESVQKAILQIRMDAACRNKNMILIHLYLMCYQHLHTQSIYEGMRLLKDQNENLFQRTIHRSQISLYYVFECSMKERTSDVDFVQYLVEKGYLENSNSYLLAKIAIEHESDRVMSMFLGTLSLEEKFQLLNETVRTRAFLMRGYCFAVLSRHLMVTYPTSETFRTIRMFYSQVDECTRKELIRFGIASALNYRNYEELVNLLK